jgi:hypothetical protein
LKNEFFDIVFNLKIDKDTYNFVNEEYQDDFIIKKNICKYIFIILNGFIILCCIYVLIFIIIPIIYFRISQCFKKNPPLSEMQSESKISFLNERFTSEA